ncbi:MAG TPA: hypothetical protein OIL99_06990 [Clostridiales bacterium]|jgi:hypothetical protein|nr:hypothetical protein [Clostridiales bacterium]
MALIKVLIIFVVILALLNKRLPLYLAMIFGSLLMIVMFRLPLATAGQTALHTLTGWDVWSVNLAMYVISVLVYELDLRHRFEDAQRAMNGLMRDPRRNTSLACMFIGLMQGPATVTICGGMVDTMAGDHLKNDEKAAVATYLRHIPEAMVPTFTGVIVACSISGISGACDSVRVRHAGRGLKRRGRGLYPAGLHHDPERRRVFAGAADERQLRLESAEPHAHLHGDHLRLFRRHIFRHGQKAPAAVSAHRPHRLRLLHAADGGILKKTNKACAKQHRP